MFQNQLEKNFPLEQITHQTDSRPFSLHHTNVSAENNNALYLHCHPELELFYVETGTLLFQAENQTCLLSEGEGIFLPSGIIHSAAKDNNCPCSFYAICFMEDMLKNHLPPYCQHYFEALSQNKMACIYPIRNTDNKNQRLLSLLPQIFSYTGDTPESYELALMGLLLLCWQDLYLNCFSEITNQKKPRGFAQHLQAVIDYMQKHLSDSVTLSQLSRQAGLSEGYLCHSFKNYTGLTPISYLNRLRIIKSCEYLIQTDKKITEIALLCGYNNISYFNRSFTHFMHMSPSAYRKRLTAEN